MPIQNDLITSNADLLDFYSKFDDTHGRRKRKDWYNDAAAAYVEARPRYPDSLVDEALKQAGLVAGTDTILEIGCGPGTATVSLAKRGFSVTAIDPAPQNCLAARQQCEEWTTNINELETTFEDYTKDTNQPPFSAIICPTSFHWITAEVASKKTAELLQSTQGCLLLWWALPPMPSTSIFDAIQDIYDDLEESKLGLEIQKYCSKEYFLPNFGKFATQINESGYYQPNDTPLDLQPQTSYYTPERFILLLSTLSPYIALPKGKREELFGRLTERLKNVCQQANQTELELTNYYGSQIFWVKNTK